MKPIFAALVIIALASPATSQGNSDRCGGNAPSAPASAPLPVQAQQASNAGPGLPETRACTIIKAVRKSPTLNDAFAGAESRLSEDGFSAMTACYPR